MTCRLAFASAFVNPLALRSTHDQMCKLCLLTIVHGRSVFHIMKLTLSLLLAPSLLFAELSVPHFFSDHMILQRERAAAIWGKADANAEISITFKGKSATTKASADGKWRAQIETGAADAEGAALVITTGTDKIEIKDVLVGEVWFASGQSNMFYTMNRSPEYAGLITKSKHPALRMFNAPPSVSSVGQ